MNAKSKTGTTSDALGDLICNPGIVTHTRIRIETVTRTSNRILNKNYLVTGPSLSLPRK